jgi:aryl-alcohol dehydrogenase-like predicted oxidoreductase
VVRRTLGTTGIELSPIGFGAFKIGRNQGIKYAHGYELPSDEEVERLIGGLLDMGINYIDTAPAYGSSEERLGRVLGQFQRDDLIVSTKVGETFENGASSYDFSPEVVIRSVARSRKRLRKETLDLVFIHSDGNDVDILEHTNCAETLIDLKKAGDIRAIGFSGKTFKGNTLATKWSDAIMTEFDLIEDNARFPAIPDLGIVIKKPLGSGTISPAEAIPKILRQPGVTSMVIGGLNLEHFRHNIEIARRFGERTK